MFYITVNIFYIEKKINSIVKNSKIQSKEDKFKVQKQIRSLKKKHKNLTEEREKLESIVIKNNTGLTRLKN